MAFSSSGNQSPVVKFYANVMDDVVAGVREAFLDEGVDDQVLQELRQMWEAKVLASKAVDPPEVVEPQPPPLQISQPAQNDMKHVLPPKQTNGVQAQPQTPKTKPATATNTPQSNATKTFSNPQPQTIATSTVQDLNNKMVPIQLTLPAPAGSQDVEPRVYSIQVPASALATDQLQRILTAQVISATMALPVNVASTLLQQHVTAALQGQANTVQANTTNSSNSNVQMNGGQNMLLAGNSNNRQFPPTNQIPGNISQIDGTYDSSDEEAAEIDSINSKMSNSTLENLGFHVKILNKKPLLVDGIYDTSDDDDDEDDDEDDDLDDDDDDDDNDDKEDEDNDEAENGIEEDPLNSGDDVSEGDNADLFETENVVVCQYDKINRSRNKWKFYLKDGIMNLAGRDYIFQKANGDAEW